MKEGVRAATSRNTQQIYVSHVTGPFSPFAWLVCARR